MRANHNLIQQVLLGLSWSEYILLATAHRDRNRRTLAVAVSRLGDDVNSYRNGRLLPFITTLAPTASSTSGTSITEQDAIEAPSDSQASNTLDPSSESECDSEPTFGQTTAPTQSLTANFSDEGFTNVRPDIPDIPLLDGLYAPMSNRSSERYEFMLLQYETWFHSCAPDPAVGKLRGDNTAECWKYDPSKTLYELARRVQLVQEEEEIISIINSSNTVPVVSTNVPASSSHILQDARDTAQEFLARQDFSGNTGGWPDCAGGVSDMPEVEKCDMKYWGHASAAWYYQNVSNQDYAYNSRQARLLKEYCVEQGWGAGFVNVTDLSDIYTERSTGLALQCLLDLHKAATTSGGGSIFNDVSEDMAIAIDYQYAMYTGNYSGQVIGAPIHSLDGHECSGYCPDMRYWIF